MSGETDRGSEVLQVAAAALIGLVQALLDQVGVVGVVLRLLVHMQLLLPPGL